MRTIPANLISARVPSDPEIELAFCAERREEEAARAFRRARLRSLVRNVLRLPITATVAGETSVRKIIGCIDESGRYRDALPVLERKNEAAFRRAYLRDTAEDERVLLRERGDGYYLEGGAVAMIRLYLLEARASLDLAFSANLLGRATGCSCLNLSSCPPEDEVAPCRLVC